MRGHPALAQAMVAEIPGDHAGYEHEITIFYLPMPSIGMDRPRISRATGAPKRLPVGPSVRNASIGPGKIPSIRVIRGRLYLFRSGRSL